MDEIEAAIDGSLEVRFAYAAQLATEFSQSRERVQDELGSWLDWWHDVLLTKAGLSDTVVNVDRTGHLAAMANRLTLGEIRACVAGVSKTAERLKENANARLALEVFMLKLPRHPQLHLLHIDPQSRIVKPMGWGMGKISEVANDHHARTAALGSDI